MTMLRPVTLIAGLLIAGMLMLPAGAGAQPDKPDAVPTYTPPANPALAPVKLPPIHEKTLKNGLKVIVVEHHELPVVSLRLQARAGSFYDPPGKAGLTQFMTGLLTQGTEKYSATQIADKIDFVGGSLGAGSSWDASHVETTVLAKYLDTAVELMRQVTLHPSFAPEEIERLRQQTLSGIENSKDQPDVLADEEFDRRLFGQYPYAQPIGGTEETVAAFTRDDVLAQYRTVFAPGHSTLAVVGDVSAKEGFRLAEKLLGDWKGASHAAPQAQLPPAPTGYRVYVVNKPDATQAQIRLGHLGVDRRSEDYFPLMVMNYIMGGGGFASRMMKTIRAEKGLTYGISSYFSARKQTGPFVIDTFTKNESILEAIQGTIDLVKQYQQEGPTEQELAEAKSYMTGSYPLNFETPSQIAGQLLNIDLFELGADYIEKYRSRIEAVSAEDVRRVAQKYLHPEDMVMVVVSKADDIAPNLEILGPVEVVQIQ